MTDRGASRLRSLLIAPIRRNRRLHYFCRNLVFSPTEWASARRARRLCVGRTWPIVMIVGCSRSGTSFAARMLNAAGLLLPGEHTAPDEFNPLGYFEEDRVVAINSDILWGSGGHWFAPPSELRVYVYQRAQIVQALARLCSCEGISGWKDPRGTLTMPAWLEVARELEIPVHVVGVFRNPVAVANSIVRHERGRVDFAQALNAWCIHNTRLLDLAASLPDRFSWFTTDQPEQNAEANLNAVAARLGLSGHVREAPSRQGVSEDNVLANPDATRGIYQRLLKAHAAQWHHVHLQTSLSAVVL